MAPTGPGGRPRKGASAGAEPGREGKAAGGEVLMRDGAGGW